MVRERNPRTNGAYDMEQLGIKGRYDDFILIEYSMYISN